MNINLLNEKNDINRWILSHNYFAAFRGMEQLVAKTDNDALKREFSSLFDSYKYMLDYMVKGYDDPERDNMLNRIAKDMFFLTDRLVAVTIPASIIGLICASALSYKRGLDLDKDPKFQARCADPETYKYMYGNTATLLDREVSKEARLSVYIFLAALGVIVLFSVCQIAGCDIRPSFATGSVDANGNPVVKPLAMNIIIQIVMIAAAAFMVILAKAQPKKAVSGAVWQSGMVAVVAIYGIAWLADTYFSNYMDEMKAGLGDIVATYPWAISLAFFAVSVLINSQGAVVVSMLPLAYSLGIPGPVLLGVFPSVYGYFFIPNYPSDIATVNFDRSGTTVIGKYLLNHSFMMPGLVSVGVSTVVAYGITLLFF